MSELKHKGLCSQHNLNIPHTFKKAGDQAFPLLDYVYGTVFLFRSGTLNQLISLKSNLKPISIHYRCCFKSSCCDILLYTMFVYVYLVPCALQPLENSLYKFLYYYYSIFARNQLLFL